MANDLIRALVEDLMPVRRLRSAGGRTLLWTGFALACVAAGTWALGARADLPARLRDPAYLCEGALLLAVFALSARSAFLLSVPGAERGAGARALPIAGLLAWAWLIGAGHATGALHPPAGWSCAGKMAALALAPAIALFAMLRRAAPLSTGWTGWLALSSAGALAIAATRMVCAKDDPRHVFLWHLGPLLVAGLVGVHLGRWLLARPRARA